MIKCTSGDETVNVIVDGCSCENMVSEALVEKIGAVASPSGIPR